MEMIVNIDEDIIKKKIKCNEDIEEEVKIGMGYKIGKIEWGDSIGEEVIVNIMERIKERKLDKR